MGVAFVGVEEERVCGGVERECELAEGIEGGLVGAGFVAADVADVEPGAFGEGGLGEAVFVAEGGEAVGEGHVDVWGEWCWGDHRCLVSVVIFVG